MPEAIARTTLRSRRTIEHRSTGRLALLGDAADLTQPSLTQGLCQAIEDSATLAQSLLAINEETTALDHYSDIRRRHLAMVTHRARWLSRVAHTANPVTTALRNALLRTTTTDDALDWLAPVVGHEIPDPPPTSTPTTTKRLVERWGGKASASTQHSASARG